MTSTKQKYEVKFNPSPSPNPSSHSTPRSFFDLFLLRKYRRNIFFSSFSFSFSLSLSRTALSLEALSFFFFFWKENISRIYVILCHFLDHLWRGVQMVLFSFVFFYFYFYFYFSGFFAWIVISPLRQRLKRRENQCW